MTLSLNKSKLDNLTNEIWKSAERLRGKFKAYEYQSVILPIIVIRRLECVLLAWREKRRAEVLAKRPKLTEKELAKLVKELELNPKQSPFSNKTKWTLRKVYEEDHTLLEENFRAYITVSNLGKEQTFYDSEPRKLINELARKEGELRMFPAATVFLVGIGATIGKVGLVPAEASCNQQIIGIVCGHRMHSRYLTYQFKIYEDVIPGIASATTLPIFDQVKTGYLPTLQPPREEQEAICAYLDEKLVEMKSIVAGIETQIATLTAYRKSLIHECVTGQRRVTESDTSNLMLI